MRGFAFYARTADQSSSKRALDWKAQDRTSQSNACKDFAGADAQLVGQVLATRDTDGAARNASIEHTIRKKHDG
jgi:hypothetical protein